jgi:hypothetical protein
MIYGIKIALIPAEAASFSLITINYSEEFAMVDIMLKIFSFITGINMRNHHDTPFAMPLLFIIFLGFIITMTVLHFIGNDQEKNEENPN